MRVDIGDRDRRPWAQSRPLGRPLGELAGLGPQRRDVAAHLRVHDVGQAGVQRGEELARREAGLLLPDGLVTGRAGATGFAAGELPNDPVGGLDQAVCSTVDVGGLVEDLQRLGEEPFRGDLTAVALEPGLAAQAGHLVDAVSLGMGGVMLPELDPGVGVGAPLGEETERRAVTCRRQHGTRGEVDADPHHLARIDSRRAARGGDSVLEDG